MNVCRAHPPCWYKEHLRPVFWLLKNGNTICFNFWEGLRRRRLSWSRWTIDGIEVGELIVEWLVCIFFLVCRWELSDQFVCFGVCHLQLQEGRSFLKRKRNNWRCVLCVSQITTCLGTGHRFIHETNEELWTRLRSTWHLPIRPSCSFHFKVQYCREYCAKRNNPQLQHSACTID